MQLDEALRKKYIPMTETTYYTLLAVTIPRHGYAIMQYVSKLTKGRIVLGTGTLYTMVGRLVADGIIVMVPQNGKKSYCTTDVGLELLREETERLGKQLSDGKSVLHMRKLSMDEAKNSNGGGGSTQNGVSVQNDISVQTSGVTQRNQSEQESDSVQADSSTCDMPFLYGQEDL